MNFDVSDILYCRFHYNIFYLKIGFFQNSRTRELENSRTQELENWRTGELENWRTGELENWRTRELENSRTHVESQQQNGTAEPTALYLNIYKTNKVLPKKTYFVQDK